MRKTGKVALFAFFSYISIFTAVALSANFSAKWDFPKEYEGVIHGYKIYHNGKNIATIADPSKRTSKFEAELDEHTKNEFYMRTYKTHGEIKGEKFTEFSAPSEIKELEQLPPVTNFYFYRLNE